MKQKKKFFFGVLFYFSFFPLQATLDSVFWPEKAILLGPAEGARVGTQGFKHANHVFYPYELFLLVTLLPTLVVGGEEGKTDYTWWSGVTPEGVLGFLLEVLR